ncbi:MAG: tripartite tricarboxylate transporter TctB family protein [Xanthobacteraceae bacterium]
MTRIKNPQDFWSGLLFLAVGIFAAWFGRVYTFGTATKMGPGYLPTVLSWGLAGLGAFLVIRALFDQGEPLERSMVRPQVFILAAIVVFAFCIERFGLAPAVIIVTVIAAFASSEMRWRETAILSVGLAILCSVLFVKLLGQPLTIWNWGY